MSDAIPLSPLDPRLCEQARLSRDARFDGLFFTAVSSTGIYCRPVCPARPPLPRHVHYYASAAAASAAGYRPCLRCRPELAPGQDQRHGDQRLARALRLIEDGALAEGALPSLAASLALSPRQLRRLFVERLGAPPIAVHTTRRLLFARQLLEQTSLPITEVALAAGFGSLRRFHAAFATAHGMPPRERRRRGEHAIEHAHSDVLQLRLAYRPPYDFSALLAFLAQRALPGVELVDAHSYRRVFGDPAAPAWFCLDAWPGEAPALRLRAHGVGATELLPLVTRLRRMFDLDAEPEAIFATLGSDPKLGPLLRRWPGQRLPGSWDGFETAVRAILGQQVSVAAARTMASRIVQRYGEPLARPAQAGLDRLFPTPATLARADLRDIGLTNARAATINATARAVLDGRVDFRGEHSLDSFVERWCALPGIGPWTAHYLAMRALTHPDAFPAADLILRRAAAATGSPPLSTAALLARAEAWRPWRAYAVLLLWRASVTPPAPPSTTSTQPRQEPTA